MNREGNLKGPNRFKRYVIFLFILRKALRRLQRLKKSSLGNCFGLLNSYVWVEAVGEAILGPWPSRVGRHLKGYVLAKARQMLFWALGPVGQGLSKGPGALWAGPGPGT